MSGWTDKMSHKIIPFMTIWNQNCFKHLLNQCVNTQVYLRLVIKKKLGATKMINELLLNNTKKKNDMAFERTEKKFTKDFEIVMFTQTSWNSHTKSSYLVVVRIKI